MNDNRFGSQEEVTLLTLHPGNEMASGETLHVEIEFFSKIPIESPIFVVTITREDGTVCLDTNTESALLSVPRIEGSGSIIFEVTRLDLGAGGYYVNAGIYERGWTYAYDYHWHAYPLTINGPSTHRGLIAPPCRWQMAVTDSGRTSRKNSPPVVEQNV